MTEALTSDCVVVGAGPGGLCAAIAAARNGVRVTLVDAYDRPGGQFFKQPAVPLEAGAPPHARDEYAPGRALLSAVAADSRIQTLCPTTVWSAERVPAGTHPFRLYCVRGESGFALDARTVVLAPGAFERVLPFPGWTLPGVMTAGAAQTLLKHARVLPGMRIVVAGSGPFLFPVAAQLVRAGANVTGVYEALAFTRVARLATSMLRSFDKAREGAGYLGELRRGRIPVRYGSAIVRADGSERVERAIVAKLDNAWRPLSGTRRTIEVDTVCCSFGFMPSTELAETLGCAMRAAARLRYVTHDASMQSSIPGLFVAGEVTAIRGSSAAMAQGEIAGIRVAESLGALDASAARDRCVKPLRAFLRYARFAQALDATYRIGARWMEWLDDETTICRCEEVSYRDVRRATSRGYTRDQRSVKALTRCGMGYCQGRFCGFAVAEIAGSDDAYRRHGFASPVSLGSV